MRQEKHLRQHLGKLGRTATFLAGLSLALLSSCGDQLSSTDDPPVNAGCAAPLDQRKSFMAPTPAAPIQVIADAAFTDQQKQAIVSAVAQWNLVSSLLLRQDVMVLSFESVPASVRAADPRDCGGRFGDPTSFRIVKETSGTRWQSLGLKDSIPGATFRCSQRWDLVQQIIYVNPSLINPTQVSSVVLHELGHAIGLDHSCQPGTGDAKFRSCGALAPDHPYRQAVMYPSLKSISSASGMNPEVKEIPRSNDKVRAQCVL